MSLINDFSKKQIEHEAGRIPECLQWIELESVARQDIKSLMLDEINLDPKVLERYGWVGIWAMTDGQLEDADRDALVDTFLKNNVFELYATSHYELHHLKNERFLGACIPKPSALDLHSLCYGWWCAGGWINRLKQHDLLWNTWREQLLFTWPLSFALAQRCEGEGETTIVGPPVLINDFLQLSKPENYKWQYWPK